ncbi:MAG: hypothetical protein AB7E80_03255 [Hyphomicrobiaceae bacterium]
MRDSASESGRRVPAMALSVGAIDQRVIAIGLTTLLVTALIWSLPAHAQEAFACGSRVVHLTREDIRSSGQDDPCLAAFILNRRRPGSMVGGSGVSVSRRAAIAPDDVPAPAPHPTRARTAQAFEAAPAASVRSEYAAAPPASEGPLLTPRVTPVTFQHEVVPALATPKTTVAAGSFDYRRIPIINAAPGEPAFFFHAR